MLMVKLKINLEIMQKIWQQQCWQQHYELILMQIRRGMKENKNILQVEK
jgi:hypothetical protein